MLQFEKKNQESSFEWQFFNIVYVDSSDSYE